jgi:hypothetical protein
LAQPELAVRPVAAMGRPAAQPQLPELAFLLLGLVVAAVLRGLVA